MVEYKEWVQSTHQGYEDPTEWNGTNPNCLLCEKEIEFMDEYCEDHQRCDDCGEREVCEEDCPNYKTEE